MIGVVVLAGCTGFGTEENGHHVPKNSKYSKEEASVSGIETSVSAKVVHVSGIENIVHVEAEELIISGDSNVIYVENSDVMKIVLSGIDNVVYIPEESNPTVDNSGIDCLVKKY